jgi:FAD/FMN-containing dehydrogenase
MHSGNLSPPGFATLRAVSWRETDKPVTEGERLTPRGLDYNLEKNVTLAVTEIPGANRIGERIVERMLLGERPVVWRNHEASRDAASLEPITRIFSTYLLQEYFVPVAKFSSFIEAMRGTLKRRRVNALNLSVRHAPADSISLLRWAPTDVFAFVLYYKQGTSEAARLEAAEWTRELIAAALAHGGRYYLPYRLDATRAQFEQAYPEAAAFAALKARVDPRARLRNLLWDKYLPVTRSS